MNEFIEKLKARLKEKLLEYINKANDEMIENGHTLDFENFLGHKEAYENVLYEIVNELAEEYKGGWISVKDKLPTETGKYLVTVKNLTGYWILKNNVFVCDYQFDDFIFQGWEDNKVIAWQPLPQPYKENENGKI